MARWRVHSLFLLLGFLVACNGTPPAPTAVVTPTTAAREFIDSAYCWASPTDVGVFNLLRFFDNGTVFELTVGPFPDCITAWSQMQPYFLLESITAFNHGEYYLTGNTLRFELLQAETNTSLEVVTGSYAEATLTLTKGAAENLTYVMVYGVR